MMMIFIIIVVIVIIQNSQTSSSTMFRHKVFIMAQSFFFCIDEIAHMTAGNQTKESICTHLIAKRGNKGM